MVFVCYQKLQYFLLYLLHVVGCHHHHPRHLYRLLDHFAVLLIVPVELVYILFGSILLSLIFLMLAVVIIISLLSSCCSCCHFASRYRYCFCISVFIIVC